MALVETMLSQPLTWEFRAARLLEAFGMGAFGTQG